MFRIKVCGVATADQARAAAAVGADAVGLNFYQASCRFLVPSAADAVAAAVPAGVLRVGLFVNAAVGEMLSAWETWSLDLLQLHGDEPPEVLAALEGRPVMRAFRIGPKGLSPALEYLAVCRAAGCLPRLVLLDACRPGHYGGTGETVDWEAVASYPSEPWHPPLVLAGGLTAENVAAAIAAVRPAAVDTASGVETSPGCKDPARMAAFCRAAQAALAAIGPRP